MGWCSRRHYRGGMTLLEALGSQIDADRLITDPDIMASYIHDDAEWAPYEMPVAVSDRAQPSRYRQLCRRASPTVRPSSRAAPEPVCRAEPTQSPAAS